MTNGFKGCLNHDFFTWQQLKFQQSVYEAMYNSKTRHSKTINSNKLGFH